jgi:putative hydrolase of HD superfamily
VSDATLLTARSVEPGAGLVRFLHRVGRLKFTKRIGWLDRGVPAQETESVADHSWRLAMLVWLAAESDPTLDTSRVLQLALVHDLAEAVTGDFPPYDPADLPDQADTAARRAFLDRRHVRAEAHGEAKRAAERAALNALVAELPPTLATVLVARWREYDEQATSEARFVKQADKLEAFLQSREYLAGHPERPMASFAIEIATALDHPALAALRDAITVLLDDGAASNRPR